MPARPNLLGFAEVAEALGVEPSRVVRWRHRGVVLPNGMRVPFPEPWVKLRATPVWRGEDIQRLRDLYTGQPGT